MPTPKDLPGLYFDQAKNRYFPIKGPIPGLKRPSISTESLENKKAHVKHSTRKKRMKPLQLLRSRELFGTSIVSKAHRHDFKQEYEKSQALTPQVWKYQGTTYSADSALEQMHGVIQTPNGLKEAYLLSTGGVNGSISLYEVGNVGECLESGFTCTPESVWPEGTKNGVRSNSSFGRIWSSPEASTSFSSSISCIRRIGRQCPDLTDDASSLQRALVTTFGSGVSGGSVYILNLSEPLDFGRSFTPRLHRRALKVDSFDCTIWTADCSRNGTHAVIGTNLGAALINLETRASSWIYCPKSDILSQQFDHSGNIILCGLRNGAIRVVDVREKQSRSSEVSSRHTTAQIVRRGNHAYPVSYGKTSKQRFEAKKNSTSFCNPSMSSSVCSLISLQSDDQYFLGSSMDGSIQLFDRRFLHRGAVQTYEGHVNSHSHLKLTVNPSETLMLSGGEDQCVRIWSIKTSDLIFEENVSNSIHATVCWFHGARESGVNPFEINHSWGAWLGSPEALFYMHGT